MTMINRGDTVVCINGFFGQGFHEDLSFFPKEGHPYIVVEVTEDFIQVIDVETYDGVNPSFPFLPAANFRKASLHDFPWLKMAIRYSKIIWA